MTATQVLHSLLVLGNCRPRSIRLLSLHDTLPITTQPSQQERFSQTPVYEALL